MEESVSTQNIFIWHYFLAKNIYKNKRKKRNASKESCTELNLHTLGTKELQCSADFQTCVIAVKSR